MQEAKSTAPRKPPTQRSRQAAETKARIYTCADMLFRTKGYDETTISDIVSAAGISVGLFYYYFKNKEEIMRLWIAGLDDQYLDYYENTLCAPEMDGVPALEKIRKMMEMVNHLFFSHGVTLSRNAYSLMIRDKMVGHLSAKRRHYYRIMDALVRLALKNGEIAPEHADVGKIVKQITIISRGCKVEWMLNDCQGDLIREEDEMLVGLFKTLRPEV